MKLAISALLVLASLAPAQASDVACPTATRTIQESSCNKSCALSDCTLQTTMQNPCGCPATLPTATLIAPCEAECPYQGCDVEFHAGALPCPTTSTVRRTSPAATPTATSTSTQTGVITSVTTLPPRTTSTSTSTSTTSSLPCPRVTHTTSPDGCEPIRCPVPTCRVESDFVIPCGCQPKTVLFVTGCATACPTGCLTRTRTTSLAC
ncbi:hypothetical protein MYCTH_2298257 [Thermothelomyces thermophilus ATCC 42464]|uniref:Uncharacterized protein n=1 Tax=Thermothelomyces thermophilus (strain ATCC 42464 / BCRC 31852 / DSM 1799) TaxID=573729 RepID=G2Q1J0_THET4|nr:uncharacterized protein MYCTH_2298257 [Thermothelomyces thermophilus ATCC 42464]AEO54981.1 hypothetical protein MYCTH_2298257 [Thermothelomyces thermophilus ATCC 42464]